MMVAAAPRSSQFLSEGPDRARRDSLRAIVQTMVGADTLVWRIGSADLSQFGAAGLTHHKVVCETALLLLVAQQALGDDVALRHAIQAFLARAMAEMIDDRVLVDLDRYPQTAGSIALLVLAARAYDVPCPIDGEVETAFRSPHFLSAERLPFRLQEALWLRERILAGPDTWHQDGHGALFGRWQHPAVLSRDDLYAITHSAMYLSDFGRRPMTHIAETAGLTTNLRHAMAMCFANADWDLLGELLLTARYLGLPQSGVEQAGEQVLWSIHDRHGMVPGLGYRADAAEQHQDGDLQFYRFVQSYHSTLVLALLAGAPSHVPPATPEPRVRINPIEALFAIRNFGSVDPIGRNAVEDWYGDEIEIGWDMLLDGQAMCCFRTRGRRDALALLEAIPHCQDMALTGDTWRFLGGEGPA